MKGPFETRAEALEVAVPGEEVWCRDAAASSLHETKPRLPWCVMTKEEADEYVRTTSDAFYVRWHHWENIR